MAINDYQLPAETTAQAQNFPDSLFNPEVRLVWGFMWFVFVIFLFTLFWAGYVLHKLHRDGGIDNWSLTPEERAKKRELERKRVVGVRRVWEVVRGNFVGKDRKDGKGEKGKDMDDMAQLERMHTVRRMRQKEKMERKREVLTEMARLRSELPQNKAFDYGRKGHEQSHQLRPLALVSRVERIKELRAELNDLDTSSSSPNLSKPLPRVSNAQNHFADSSLPTTTTTPHHPSRNPTFLTIDTWEYNNSPPLSPTEGEEPFSIFTRRAQAFENGSEDREAVFSSRLEAANGVAERQLGRRHVVEMPTRAHLNTREERGGRKIPLRQMDDVFVVGEGDDEEKYGR